MRLLPLLLVCATAVLVRAADAPKPVRVLVWDERQPEQKQAYTNFLGNAIADHLRARPGFTVTSEGMDDPEQGLAPAALDATDVLVYWAHKRHKDLDDARAADLVRRVREGRLSIVFLHSAHWAKPFVLAMEERSRTDARGQLPADQRETARIEEIKPAPWKLPKYLDPLTPRLEQKDGAWKLYLPNCVFPAYRNDGKPSRMQVSRQDHPIAAGLPEVWEIPQTEMYDEPFHVPAPDVSVFEESWAKGEKFRSGMVWTIGKGRVSYYRPGHETYPVFRQAENLRVIENTCRFLGANTQ